MTDPRQQFERIANQLPIGRDPASVRQRLEAMETLLERAFTVPGTFDAPALVAPARFAGADFETLPARLAAAFLTAATLRGASARVTTLGAGS